MTDHAVQLECAARGLERIADGLDKGPLDLMTQNVMAEAMRVHVNRLREIAGELRNKNALDAA